MVLFVHVHDGVVFRGNGCGLPSNDSLDSQLALTQVNKGKYKKDAKQHRGPHFVGFADFQNLRAGRADLLGHSNCELIRLPVGCAARARSSCLETVRKLITHSSTFFFLRVLPFQSNSTEVEFDSMINFFMDA